MQLQKFEFIHNSIVYIAYFSTLQKLEKYLNSVQYAYLGSISVEIGQTLNFTELLLQELQYKNLVKELSKKEKKDMQLDERCCIWKKRKILNLEKDLI